MTDILSLRNKAKELALKAIEYDESNNYEEACKHYILSAEKLKACIAIDSVSKEVYKKKAMEYCERAAELKKKLGKVEDKKPEVEQQEATKKEEKKSDEKGETNKEEKKEDKQADAETKKLMESLSGCIVTEKPNIKWTDVAGLDKAKEALQEAVILPLRFPQLFTGKRKPWKGILLYGPPGTGKSYLAKACATEAKGTFYSLSASNIVSKWMGESERLVRALFDLARQTKPSVIFIDEIDSLLSNRSEGENESIRRLKTEFLVQMQGVGKDDHGILVLGATNIPWDLDPAVRRRFQRKIYISLPDFEARRHMLKLNLGTTTHILTDEDFEELASRTEGFSGSDIFTLTQDAIYEPLRKCQNAKYFRLVNGLYTPCSPSDVGAFKMSLNDIPEPDKLNPPDVHINDYLSALNKIKPTVSEKDLEKQEEFTRDFGQEG